MMAERLLGAAIEQRLHGILRVHVLILHEPARLVGTDGQDRQTQLPVLLGDEKKANVFLRADEPAVAAKLHMKGADPALVFGELRERKNKS